MRLKLSISCMIACCALAGLLLVVSPALAGQGRLFTGSFGGASSTTPDPYPLAGSPSSIAVDNSFGPSSGDVYVADSKNYRVEKFDPSGHLILMFGKDVNRTKAEEAGSSEAERDVCTVGSGNVCQAGTKGSEPGAFTGGMYVAVDGSFGASAGDVYVGETTVQPVKGTVTGEGAVMKFDEHGEIVPSWGVDGQLKSTSVGPIGAIHGITVSQTGEVWIYGSVEKEVYTEAIHILEIIPVVFGLGQDSSVLTHWDFESIGLVSLGTGISVDNGNVYLGHFNYEMAELTITGQFVKYISRGTQYGGSAFDPSAGVLDQAAPHGFNAYSVPCGGNGEFGGCTPTEVYASSHVDSEVKDLAVNSSSATDTIYVLGMHGEVAALSVETLPDVVTAPASDLSTASVRLNGTVNPDGVALTLTGCRFEWGTSTEPYEHTSACEAPDATEVGTGSNPVAVHADIATEAGKTYHFRLVATNVNQLYEPTVGADVVVGPPRIDNSSVADIATESATLLAEVDPQNVSTSYRFEYLSEAEYDENGQSFAGAHAATVVPVPDAAIGAGEKDLRVSQHIQGLSPQTVYRYRIVVHSVLGEGAEALDGPAQSFTTWGGGSFALLDGRGWEMVSPLDKHGALVEPIGEDWVIQASANGGALAYVTRTPTELNPDGYLIYQSVLARRGAGGGWSSRDLAIPHVAETKISVGQGWEYRGFSEDLSRAFVQPFGAFVSCVSALGEPRPCLSSEANEQTAFLQDLETNAFTPLVTGAEGLANVPSHTVFGKFSTFSGQECPPNLTCGPIFLAATPDASHVLLESWTPLTASPSANVSVPNDSMYEWSEDAASKEQLRLISVLPANAKGETLPASEPIPGITAGNIRNAISPDGERAVFTSGKHLYLREQAPRPQSPIGPSGECTSPDDACTIQLDAGVVKAGELNLNFQTASADLSHVYFTDGAGLYEYDTEARTLVTLASGAEVLGAVIGASEDGSFVYFVGNGALAPGAVKNKCAGTGSETNLCNLYVMHRGPGGWEAPKLVAVVSDADSADWGSGLKLLNNMAARVSPDGNWLAFVSHRSLTGRENRDATNGERDQEVYEYEAASGTLTCVSCSPAGARPHGLSAEQIDSHNGGVAGGEGTFAGWIAGNVPGWTPNRFGGSVYQSRYLADSGRLFFDSSDALVPKDIDGTEDVYEYEPLGVPIGGHACSEASTGSVVFEPARGAEVEGRVVGEGAGCVGLISSGESPRESAFLDASETGSEVFFMTTSKLVGEDIDGSYDVYDARECTAVSPCAPARALEPPPCLTEASCRPAPSSRPEIFGAAGSETFSGPGNLAPALPAAVARSKAKSLTRAQLLSRALKVCRGDGSVRRRLACERAARRRFAAHKIARRATSIQRSSRKGGRG